MNDTPRMIDLVSVARRMGRSRSWLYRKLDDLNRLGFPSPHPVIGRWDSAQVEHWLDMQATGAAGSQANEQAEA